MLKFVNLLSEDNVLNLHRNLTKVSDSTVFYVQRLK
jgi:hypothetical protein